MAIVEKTTHTRDAQGNLISQFKGKTDLDFYIASFTDSLAELEGVLFDIFENTLTISATTGANLDVLGELVGVEREGRTDSLYAMRIAAQILLNIGSGTIEDIIAIIDSMTGGSNVIEVTEPLFPAFFEVETLNILTAGLGAEVGALVASAKPAAVGGQFSFFESAPPFTFDTASFGFDDGKLAGVVGF
ncbi:hypothetical protein LCGC14_1716540 [marine sediment metagenome]|uniref:Uncharacterized protein n=1 Tax=marine sediment metagenome TaxID=412755 RepID=A0A0F9I193_9ZZZZ